MEIGERVKHRTFEWLKVAGTIVDAQPALMPFFTERAVIPGRVKVKWDNGDESGWLSTYDLEVIDTKQE